MTIDSARKSIQWGHDRSYVDSRKFEHTDSASDIPCTFKVTQFVQISNDSIIFGQNETNVNRCGDTPDHWWDPDLYHKTFTYIIDRNIGSLIRKFHEVRYEGGKRIELGGETDDHGEHMYNCTALEKAIP
jgi:hypothetical protein